MLTWPLLYYHAQAVVERSLACDYNITCLAVRAARALQWFCMKVTEWCLLHILVPATVTSC